MAVADPGPLAILVAADLQAQVAQAADLRVRPEVVVNNLSIWLN